MASPVDHKRSIPAYRAQQGRFDVVDVPDLQYLMIDGHGDPNTSPDFTGAVEALYPLAYTLKRASRSDLDRDFVVMPLEGLWWADDMAALTAARDKSQWDWTLMIMVPAWIDAAMWEVAVADVTARRDPVRLGDVRFASLSEGRCVQTLHVGTFDDETAVLDRMHHEVIPSLGLRMTGTHHEIYLSDARRVVPERMRTILRQPVAAVEG